MILFSDLTNSEYILLFALEVLSVVAIAVVIFIRWWKND